ncbi:aldo/keto reductase [Saccharothrix obliqua]|uniref:aldo/keto reductase n=1 Tax=Saccharothrix obliqua TaxID=2861747 RepID=UPI001C5E383F|nr:aldo/keto reductase [Saccharothrix obliqua]MBW4717869.1 aldo/keto reductase [Saccharothrix obliqua]
MNATRSLGSLHVGPLGLGCMGMTEFYGPTDDAESCATIDRALDLGVTLFDTADVYALGQNEKLLGRALTGHRREQAVVATKIGVIRPGKGLGTGVRGDAEYVRAAAEASLRRLGLDHVDLLYQARVDPGVPIEETVGAMARLVAEGKVRHIGLSEASAATVRRAHVEHPLTAVQTEWSLWSRGIENEVVPLCRELGIGLVANAPLGRGFWTGRYLDAEALDPGDFRRIAQPRFSSENLRRNAPLVHRLTDLATERGVTPAQLALAWLLHQGDDVVPIPGTKRRTHLMENLGALELSLDPEEVDAVAAAVPPSEIHGERYTETSLAMVDL